MRQAALTLGSAPDCGTFIYTLKVPHTHPPMPKVKVLQDLDSQCNHILLLLASLATATFMVVSSHFFFLGLERDVYYLVVQ